MNRACAPVAQLDRATDYESVGRRFESFRAHHKSKKIKYFQARIPRIEFLTNRCSEKRHYKFLCVLQNSLHLFFLSSRSGSGYGCLDTLRFLYVELQGVF